MADRLPHRQPHPLRWRHLLRHLRLRGAAAVGGAAHLGGQVATGAGPAARERRQVHGELWIHPVGGPRHQCHQGGAQRGGGAGPARGFGSLGREWDGGGERDGPGAPVVQPCVRDEAGVRAETQQGRGEVLQQQRRLGTGLLGSRNLHALDVIKS